MNILIPMAGAGQRFKDAGYMSSKPAIPTYDRRDGKKKPMVVCAVNDLPGLGTAKVIFVERNFHHSDGTEAEIKRFYPDAHFITVDALTEGQACTCLLAKELIDNEEELLIAGCDNGMEYDADAFDRAKQENDVLVFTYRHNESVLKNPNAYGWILVSEDGKITGTSIKKAISDHPMEDHAVVATFWFRRGSMFVEAAEKMIGENDRINHEFYVDQVIKHVLELHMRASVFEIKRYFGWGTPEDYEIYQKTHEYWSSFYDHECKRGLIREDCKKA